jgi:hypothetical protein
MEIMLGRLRTDDDELILSTTIGNDKVEVEKVEKVWESGVKCISR